MFGLACKGLHCAGCGRGIPLTIILFLGGLAFTATGMLFDLILMVAGMVVSAAVVALGIIAVFMRKGPPVAYVRSNTLSYSQLKFLETGDEKWLKLSGPIRLEVSNGSPGTDMEIYDGRTS